MVSIRRRKLLGYCSGIISSEVELPRQADKGTASDKPNQRLKPTSVHPVQSTDFNESKENELSKLHPGSSNLSGTSSSKEEQSLNFPGHPVKRRKQHRRKHVENQEPCIMRGVYFKNMKWQAAIKVDKKQIHLGTVGSQEEAAHLYDRAAYLCGREPNFELSEEEKFELRQVGWEEFLTLTRHAITNKKHQKRLRAGPKNEEFNSFPK
ncbi:hypothetical protein ACHQM5_013916 [Ranunculus cassubicifolius]